MLALEPLEKRVLLDGSGLLQQAVDTQLPEDARGWESIPGVIRNDGVDTFRVEVDTNGPVADVRFEETHVEESLRKRNRGFVQRKFFS